MDDDVVVDVMRIYRQILKEESSASHENDNSMFGYIQMGLFTKKQRLLLGQWSKSF